VNLDFELPALEAHQHPAELLPGDLMSIDHEQWYAPVLLVISGNAATRQEVGNRPPELFVVLEVTQCERAAHALDELSHQGE
jgi:hypothetical protein